MFIRVCCCCTKVGFNRVSFNKLHIFLTTKKKMSRFVSISADFPMFRFFYVHFFSNFLKSPQISQILQNFWIFLDFQGILRFPFNGNKYKDFLRFLLILLDFWMLRRFHEFSVILLNYSVFPTCSWIFVGSLNCPLRLLK